MVEPLSDGRSASLTTSESCSLGNAFELHSMEYPTSHLYYLSIHAILKESMYSKKIQVRYSMVYHESIIMQMNKGRIIYLNYGERFEDMIDHRSYTHNLSSSKIWSFIYSFAFFTFYWYITNSHCDQLQDGLIALLVEHCNGMAEVMSSNPVQAWIFFRL